MAWHPHCIARGCLARGVLFAEHPARFHSGFEKWLWEKQFTMTYTEPPDNMALDLLWGSYLVIASTPGGVGGQVCFLYIITFVHCTCGVDSWTWGSWACDVHVSVLHILLCCTNISVLYSDDDFFDTTDTASFHCWVKRLSYGSLLYGIHLGMCS